MTTSAARKTAAATPARPRTAKDGTAGPRSLHHPGIWSGALAARYRAFERYFHSRVLPTPDDRETPRRLYAAMRYAAFSPGKRLRPLLVLTACEAAGGDWRRALPAAAAVELVHAFSLVHDDLPAMDDDDYRRGRLTTHKKFGEAMGILAGDALLAEAFLQLLELARRKVPSGRIVQATECLASAAGRAWLIGGQVLDLEAEGRRVTRQQVVEIHSRKTGALIGASMALGGIVAGAGATSVRNLAIAGAFLGLAFQVQDDQLNMTSSLRALGKRTGTDAQRGKATYQRAAGRDAAEWYAEVNIVMARKHLAKFGRRARNLDLLIDVVARRER